MENKIEEKFLPIGTVVVLKGGKKELMIINYCVKPTGKAFDKNGEIAVDDNTMFDYGACFYPEGLLTTEQLFTFNHDQIDKVLFKGYETDDQKAMSKLISIGLECDKNN